MLPGKYEPGPVIEATLRVYVNGIERPHLSASWEGNTTGGLPESLVAAGDGIYSRTGSITWAPGTSVTTHPLAPVGEKRWAPRHGDKVYIEAEVGGVRFPRFTGYLGASTYSLTSDEVTTAIADGLGAALNQAVTIPPTADQGRYLNSSWVPYRALEQVGLGALPPTTSDTVIHDSYQGGIMPAVGVLIGTGTGYGTPGSLDVATGVRHRPADGASRAGRDIMVVSRASHWHSPASVTVKLTSGTTYTLTWDKNTKTLRFDRNGATLFQQHLPDAPEEMPLAFKLNPTAHRIWVSYDESVLVSTQTDSLTAEVQEVTGAICMGVRVDYLTRWEDCFNMVSSLTRVAPSFQRSLLEQERILATRGFENVTAERVVSTWCQATLAAVWVDERGKVNIRARDRALGATVGVSDRVEEKVFTGAWESSRDGIYDAVRIKGETPNIMGDTAYQPSNIIELTPEETLEFFHTFPDEIDVVDIRPWEAVIDARRGVDNRKKFSEDRGGSWWAISFENLQEPEGYRWTGPNRDHEELTAKLELLGQRAIKMTFKVSKNSPSRIEKYYLVTPTLGADSLRFAQKGLPMPIVRARRVVTWSEYQVQAGAPRPGAIFDMDCGWWLTEADATRVADALAAELRGEAITFDGLEMLWDPRKQIGDVHKLTASDELGARWEVDYLLTGYREAWDGCIPTCSYDVQAIKVTDTREGKTYGDVYAAYATYGRIPASKTYGDVYAALPERSQ